MTGLWSAVIDTVISGILLSLAKMMGLKQNNHWVKEFLGLLLALAVFITWPTPLSKFSHCSCLNGRWNSACMSDTMYRGVGKRLHTLHSHPTPGVTQGFSWEWETLAISIIGCWYHLPFLFSSSFFFFLKTHSKQDTSAFQPGISQTCNIIT